MSFTFPTATRHASSAALQPGAMVLEFVFLPAGSEAAAGAAAHPPRPKQWRNPNRPGTPLAFWREVKDVLRLLTFHRRRGSYIAPGPHGRRNNIERDPWPGRPHSPLPALGEGIAQLQPRRAQLAVPPLPGFQPPSLGESLPLALTQLPPLGRSLPSFRNIKLTPDAPIRYRQEVHFVGDTDQFINRVAAQQVFSELLALMQKYPTIHVTIEGNAATDFRDKINHVPYGHNKALLKRYPLWGYYEGKPYYGTTFRTMGDLMLARARAIGNLLISRGISPSRVHYSIGALSYGDLKVPGSATRKRRATIIISERP